jgi:hypothetical protein
MVLTTGKMRIEHVMMQKEGIAKYRAALWERAWMGDASPSWTEISTARRLPGPISHRASQEFAAWVADAIEGFSVEILAFELEEDWVRYQLTYPDVATNKVIYTTIETSPRGTPG